MSTRGIVPAGRGTPPVFPRHSAAGTILNCVPPRLGTAESEAAMKKKLLPLLLTLLLALSLLPTAAFADGVDYIGSTAASSTCTSYTPINTDVTYTTADVCTTWSDGWYVLENDVTITGATKEIPLLGNGTTRDTISGSTTGAVQVSGNVHLILKDDCTLTINGTLVINSGASLTIYGQSGQSGALTVNGAYYDGTNNNNNSVSGYAGILNHGTLTVNGGVVTANGGNNTNMPQNSAAHSSGIRGGTITLNHGTLNACGGDVNITKDNGNCIGQSFGVYGVYDGATLTVNGGTLKAEASDVAGDSRGIQTKIFALNAGTVTATGGSSGGSYSYGLNSETITISGGSLAATAKEAVVASIGILCNMEGTFTVTGSPTITATGSTASGIGRTPFNSSAGITSNKNIDLSDMTGGSLTARTTGTAPADANLRDRVKSIYLFSSGSFTPPACSVSAEITDPVNPSNDPSAATETLALTWAPVPTADPVTPTTAFWWRNTANGYFTKVDAATIANFDVGTFRSTTYAELTFTEQQTAPTHYYYAPTGEEEKIEAPKTFDPGVATYAALSLLSLTGTALTLKKRP